MSPTEIAQAVRRRLAAQLADDHAVLGRLADRILDLSRPSGDERTEAMRAPALAFGVERWHGAAEALLERIVRAIDGDVPTGPTWHAELLRAAEVEVDELRPAIVSRAAALELRKLLKLRYFARRGYDREPEPARMDEHAGRVGRANAALADSLDTFDAWLRAPSGG